MLKFPELLPLSRSDAIDRIRLIMCLKKERRGALEALLPYTGLSSINDITSFETADEVYDLIESRSDSEENVPEIIDQALKAVVKNWIVCRHIADTKLSRMGNILVGKGMLSQVTVDNSTVWFHDGGEFVEVHIDKSDVYSSKPTTFLGGSIRSSTIGADGLILSESDAESVLIKDTRTLITESAMNTVIVESSGFFKAFDESSIYRSDITTQYFVLMSSSVKDSALRVSSVVIAEDSLINRCTLDLGEINHMSFVNCSIDDVVISISDARDDMSGIKRTMDQCRIGSLKFDGDHLHIKNSRLGSLEAEDETVKVTGTKAPPGWKISKSRFLVRA